VVCIVVCIQAKDKPRAAQGRCLGGTIPPDSTQTWIGTGARPVSLSTARTPHPDVFADAAADGAKSLRLARNQKSGLTAVIA